MACKEWRFRSGLASIPGPRMSGAPYGRVGSPLVAEVGLVADRRQGRSPADTWADTTTSHGRLMLAVLGDWPLSSAT